MFDEQNKGFNIYIKDADILPYVTSALTIDMNEDGTHTFTKAEFNYKHDKGLKREFYSVIISVSSGDYW